MLGVLCARPKPWIVTALSLAHGVAHHRLSPSSISFVSLVCGDRRPRHHSSACRIASIGRGPSGAASIWHAILPSRGNYHSKSIRSAFHHEQKGEGSWNVACDVRPARWLHGSDSAWLLFGVCACLAPLDYCGGNLEGSVATDQGFLGSGTDEIRSDGNDRCSIDFRVTDEKIVKNKDENDIEDIAGVPADGRCLFRAVSHGACLRSGEEAPNENRQRELADDLRARVADELLKRREEIEWVVEGEFDMYVKSIQQPNAWGGEPELMMASHVLQTPISVFMIHRSSGDLINIASYGQEYGKDKQRPIKVLFHGYGHYDVLETFSDRIYQKK